MLMLLQGRRQREFRNFMMIMAFCMNLKRGSVWLYIPDYFVGLFESSQCTYETVLDAIESRISVDAND